jgi:hypothetical protein
MEMDMDSVMGIDKVMDMDINLAMNIDMDMYMPRIWSGSLHHLQGLYAV